jgi:acylphosphatase
MSRQRVNVFYTGRVQGVGFRYTAKTRANGFEVAGTVRNLADGRVELIAEGSRQELEDFLADIRDSEVGRFIKDEQVAWSEAKQDLKGFEIVR